MNTDQLMTNVPASLRNLRAWVCWKAGMPNAAGKFGKQPYYADGTVRRGAQGGPDDLAQLVGFDEACAAAQKHGFDGVGLAMLGQGVTALDFDHCVVDGVVDPHVLDLIEGTYAEISPSGRGVRAFVTGEMQDRKSDVLEVFSGTGFVTLTGALLSKHDLFGWVDVAAPTSALLAHYHAVFGATCTPNYAAVSEDDALLAVETRLGWTVAKARGLLAGIDPDVEYHQWVGVLMALHHEFEGNEEGLSLAVDWSQGGTKFAGDRDIETHWRSFGRKSGGRPVTGATILRMADDGKAHAVAVEAVETSDGRSGDVEIAHRLAGFMSGTYLHEHSGRGWLHWDRGAWRACSHGEEIEAAKAHGQDILARAALGGVDNAKKLAALAIRSMSAAGITAGLQLARSDPRIAAAPGEFDRDPEVLNVANGVVDLRQGLLLQADPTMRLSRQCAVDFVPGATSVRWVHFLDQISCSDPEWVGYLQRLCGYAVTGYVREEVLAFWLGRGANGKSVLANLLRRILDSYCTTVAPGLLMASPTHRDGEAATPGLASLQGARLVLANEVEAGQRLSGQAVKTAVSTEAVAARHLYGRAFSYVPTHKIIVRGNHRPIVTDTDDGIWRRLHLLEFRAQFNGPQRDNGLEDRLWAEAPAILAWMVAGAVEYLRDGLRPPAIVTNATKQYREDSDLLGQWLVECCEVGPALTSDQGAAYNSYCDWCRNSGLRPVTKNSFTRALSERGIATHRASTGRRAHLYQGFALIDLWPGAASTSEINLFAEGQI